MISRKMGNCSKPVGDEMELLNQREVVIYAFWLDAGFSRITSSTLVLLARPVYYHYQ